MTDPIHVKISEENVVKSLRRLARVTTNLRPLMLEISEIMLAEVEDNLEAEGRPTWPELSDATIAARQRKGYWPGKILQMRGELAASLQNNATNDTATVSTNKVYAAIQHFGGWAGRNREVWIPERPYMEISSIAVQEIMDAVERYIDRNL